MTDQAPYRQIVSRSIRKERGPSGRVYADEVLECGHSYATDATGAARDKAKRRRCVTCLDGGLRDRKVIRTFGHP
jgi:hypothetical protein